MEEKTASTDSKSKGEREKQEAEARKKLSRPRKDKTEVTIGPTDRTGPDVVIG